MMPRLAVLATVAALTAVALTGCGSVGPMTSTSPEIGEVTAVVLDTSGDVTITEGEPSLTIHAPENVIDDLTYDVEDGVLELGRSSVGPMFGSYDIRYELTVRSLDAIELNGSGDITSTVTGGDLTIEINGSGDVEIEGLDADAVDVRIDGSGDVDLAGSADTLSIAIDGSGEVDSDGLDARDATVEISGSGDVRLHVTGTLDVEISGSGSVRHSGGAEVESDISGSGDVEADD